jgi:hypothetical protein
MSIQPAAESWSAASGPTDRIRRRRAILITAMILVVVGSLVALLKTGVDHVRDAAARTSSV